MARSLVGLGGLLLLLVAALAGPLGLSHAPGVTTAQLSLGALGAAVLAVALLGRRFLSLYRGTAIVLLNAVVLLCALDLATVVALRVLDRSAGSASAGPVEEPFFPPDEDPAVLLRETWAPSIAPDLYVGWKGRAYRGRAVHVGSDGLRVTPGSRCGEGSFRVFAFGGSTMWGQGAPDDRTIPAYLVPGIEARVGRPVCMRNHAQLAWISTQSASELLIELERGEVPDLAIFYDGYNDTFSAFAMGRVATPENLFGPQDARTPLALLRTLFGTTSLGRVVTRALSGSTPERLAEIRDRGPLAGSVAATYGRFVLGVEALGQQFGFEPRFFWQPQLAVGRKPRTEAEERIARDHPWLNARLVAFTQEVYRRVADLAAADERVTDLSDAFADTPQRVYIDPVHVTSVGNRRVADAMLEALAADPIPPGQG